MDVSSSVSSDNENESLILLPNKTLPTLNQTVSANSRVVNELNSTQLKFFFFFLVSMLGCILNCGTIAVMFQSKRIRRVNYLIANLSITAISLAVYMTIYVGDSLKIFTHFRGVYLCGIMSFIRNVLVSVISLSVFSISYERIRSLKNTIRHLLISRVILFIWAFCSITMIPMLFNRVYEHQPSSVPTCKKVSPFGWDAFAVAFELMRFIVFHVSLCAYMTFELYEIRSKTKYLYLFKTLPNERLRQKVQRVRFVYIFSITFMLLWLPFGFLLCLAIMQYRISWSIQPFSFLKQFPDIRLYVWIVMYCYILVVPIITFVTNEDISQFSRSLSCVLQSSSRCGETAANDASNVEGNDDQHPVDISGVDETFNKTTTPQAFVTDSENTPDVEEIDRI